MLIWWPKRKHDYTILNFFLLLPIKVIGFESQKGRKCWERGNWRDCERTSIRSKRILSFWPGGTTFHHAESSWRNDHERHCWGPWKKGSRWAKMCWLLESGKKWALNSPALTWCYLPNNVRGEHVERCVSSPQTCDAKLAIRVSFDRAEELR